MRSRLPRGPSSFLSTLSLRRATSLPETPTRVVLFLSTLSLRRATILLRARQRMYRGNFYPRSPCGERRVAQGANFGDKIFLSTLSLRRATMELMPLSDPPSISIHALLAESDQLMYRHQGRQNPFLSTLSLRRATHYDNYNLHCVEISIHALLAESDLSR